MADEQAGPNVASDPSTASEVPPPLTVPGVAARSSRSVPLSVVLAVLVGLLLVTTVTFGALWLGARSEADDLKAGEAARIAEENARPDLYAIGAKEFASTRAVYDGDHDSFAVTIYGTAITSAEPALERYLEELGFSSAVSTRMGQTRALDGTQTAEGDHVNATWTYHPDDGLQVVFELEK